MPLLFVGLGKCPVRAANQVAVELVLRGNQFVRQLDCGVNELGAQRLDRFRNGFVHGLAELAQRFCRGVLAGLGRLAEVVEQITGVGVHGVRLGGLCHAIDAIALNPRPLLTKVPSCRADGLLFTQRVSAAVRCNPVR